MTQDLDAARIDFIAALRTGDRSAALAVAVSQLQSGVTPLGILDDLVGASMVEVGLGWQSGAWSVAMEHRASAIAQTVVHAVAAEARRRPDIPEEGSRGQTIIVSAAGEWHSLPALLAAEALRLRGVDVTLLSPSIPASGLAGSLGAEVPPAVGVTCSMTASLAGAWRTISALREMGTTIICGGRGFGPQGRWGLALGADAWAPDLAQGSELMLRALGTPRRLPREPLGSEEVTVEVRMIDRGFDSIVAAATTEALDRWPYLSDRDDLLRATREDFGFTLRAIQSAIVVGDPALLIEYVQWFESVLEARSLRTSMVASCFQVLGDAIPPERRLARQAASVGLAACSTAPMSPSVPRSEHTWSP